MHLKTKYFFFNFLLLIIFSQNEDKIIKGSLKSDAEYISDPLRVSSIHFVL